MRLSGDDYRAEEGASSDPKAPAAAWLCVRMTKPTLEYTTVPRWHRDGVMFYCDQEGDVNWKYAATLLGNPTRLLAENEQVKRVMSERGDRRRVASAEELSLEPLVDVRNEQIIRFTWGQDDSPVHSEPDMNTDRVFVLVLYGSEREMRGMCRIRKTSYRE